MSSVIGAHKPDERIFAAAGEKLGVPRANILHIGDSLREDVEGARQAGINALRIRRSGVEQFYDVPNLTELLPLLEKPINAKAANQL
jgi:putative hydrolase of the HAD superfamily